MPNKLEQQAWADTRQLLAGIGAAIRSAAILALPVLLRGVCVGAAVFGISLSLPAAWQAYGGDVPALLPALVVSVLPVTAAVLAKLAWGGLLLAGVATAIAGSLLAVLPAFARSLLVIGAVSGLLFYRLKISDEGSNHA